MLGSTEDGPQAPQGAPVTVFRAFRFLPLAFITQAVSEPLTGLIEGQPQESKIARGQVRARLGTGAKFFEENGDNECPCVVIGGVTFWIVRDVKDSVFQDPRVISHPTQMI